MAISEPVPASQIAGDSPRFGPGSGEAIAVVLATITIDIFAIILSPSSDASLFAGSSGRAYLAAAAATTAALFVGKYVASRPGPTEWMTIASASLLITLAPTLFLVGRIGLVSIIVTLVLATAIGLSGVRFASQREDHWAGLTRALVPALSWIGIVGVSSMDVEGRYQYPFVAALAAAAAVLLPITTGKVSSTGAFTITAAVIGVELSIAMSFLKISPYVEATLWLLAAGLVISTLNVVERRFGV